MIQLFFSFQILGVLAQDGIVRFININTCKLLFDVGSLDDRINNFVVSPNGRHLLTITDGGNVKLHSVKAITAEINKVSLLCTQIYGALRCPLSQCYLSNRGVNRIWL